jgi:hypothetical protein
MRLSLVVLMMFSSALAGAWISARLRHEAPAVAPASPPDTTPERVIPEQSLSLEGIKGNAIGSVEVRDDGTAFYLYPTAAVLAYDSGRTVLHLWGKEKGGLMISVSGHDVVCMECPGVEGMDRLTPLFPQPAPSPKGLGRSIHDLLFPPPPAKLSPTKPDDVVPTSDLRLVTKRGVRFATVGLTSSGDPAIALTGRSGNVQLVWVQRGQALGDDWQELAAFDDNGALRVSLKLRPGKAADLVLFDGKHLPYSFKNGKLTQFGDGAFESLQSLRDAPTRPVVLTDVRHQQLWKAP